MTKLVKSVIKCNHKLYHYSLSSLNYVSLKQFSTKKSDLINGNNNISTKENNDVSRIKNDVNKEHIQIHTYRSLVTVSQLMFMNFLYFSVKYINIIFIYICVFV